MFGGGELRDNRRRNDASTFPTNLHLRVDRMPRSPQPQNAQGCWRGACESLRCFKRARLLKHRQLTSDRARIGPGLVRRPKGGRPPPPPTTGDTIGGGPPAAAKPGPIGSIGDSIRRVSSRVASPTPTQPIRRNNLALRSMAHYALKTVARPLKELD